MARSYSLAVLSLTCISPTSLVIAGEIIPVEVRSAVKASAWPSTSALPSVRTQTFLYMMCRHVHLPYAAWVAVMTAFVVAFLPESIGVPLEAMSAV
jgi:hypothetical protein